MPPNFTIIAQGLMSALPDSSQIAGRYSAAIFALAAEKNKEAEVAACFNALAEAITGYTNLARALRNPLISRENKAGALIASVKDAKRCGHQRG